MADPTALKRAQRAYAAYGASTGGLTHDGRQMPAWEDLGPEIQQAWVAAANAAAASSPCQHDAGTVVVSVRLDPKTIADQIRATVRDMRREFGLGTENGQ